MLNSLVPSAASGSAPCLSRVLGAFQPVEREWRMPAGTELENTLAESHFPGGRDSAALSKLLWQQRRARKSPRATQRSPLFPNSNPEGGSGREAEVGGPRWEPHRPSSPHKGHRLLSAEPGAEHLPCPREGTGGLRVSRADS